MSIQKKSLTKVQTGGKGQAAKRTLKTEKLRIFPKTSFLTKAKIKVSF